MASAIRLKRGNNANLAALTLQAGEPAFVLDTGKLYVGNGTQKVLINPDLPASAAPLNSPAFTGTPTAPTAAPGTNTTQIATTAFIQAAIAALVASSPAALDTLNELAAALGNDANFATTMTNALALKAPLASPGLTGTPTTPTAAADTNTTQIASTAFVIGQAASVAPVMNGVAAVGTSKKYAREDHVHATDTSRAPLASPTFTGTPAAPTPATADNSTKIATTAFVKAQGYLTDGMDITIDGGTF